MGGTDDLQPDGLPDAGHGRVPDALGCGNLLPAGLPGLVSGVKHLDAESLRPLFHQCGGNVETEGSVSARMFADLRAVDPDFRLPVHSAEVQENALAGPSFREGECALIPEKILPADEFADTRKGGFHRERNENLPVRGEFPPGLRHLAERRDGIIPQPVETHPLRPHHLRPRILGKRILRIDLRSPPRLDIIARRRPGRLLRRLRTRQRHRRRHQKNNQSFHYRQVFPTNITFLMNICCARGKSCCRSRTPVAGRVWKRFGALVRLNTAC